VQPAAAFPRSSRQPAQPIQTMSGQSSPFGVPRWRRQPVQALQPAVHVGCYGRLLLLLAQVRQPLQPIRSLGLPCSTGPGAIRNHPRAVFLRPDPGTPQPVRLLRSSPAPPLTMGILHPFQAARVQERTPRAALSPSTSLEVRSEGYSHRSPPCGQARLWQLPLAAPAAEALRHGLAVHHVADAARRGC
jgi:hypothetical protein